MEGRGIVINTFYELESQGIDYLRRLTGKPVWSIGPLLPLAALGKTGIDRTKIRRRGKAPDIDEDKCLRWLDSRRLNSVIFVCLASQFFLNHRQIRALASGLDASGQAGDSSQMIDQTVLGLRREGNKESMVIVCVPR